MKKIIIPVILSLIVLLSCRKNKAGSGMVNGTITGPDMALCACCGGAFIVIEDSPSTYRIESVPPQSGIDLQAGPFPIGVKLTYTMDTSKCPGWGYIKSDDIRKR